MKIKKYIYYLLIIQLLFWINITQANAQIAITIVNGANGNPTNFLNLTTPYVVCNKPNNNWGRTIIYNEGSVPINLELSIKTNTAGWTPIALQPGPEQFRLYGLFTTWNLPPVISAYLNNDIITTTPKAASTNVFAIPTDIVGVKAYDIPPSYGASPNQASGSQRNLFFRLDAPSQTQATNLKSVSITIQVKAVLWVPPADEPLTKPTQTLLTPYAAVYNVLVFPGLGDYLGVHKTFNIRILNSRGRMVKQITDKNQWDGTDSNSKIVPSGAYIYQYEYNGKFICGIVVVAK